MTTKLCILDKDGTLIRPASGETFVQHPQDQELLPGVKEQIAGLKAEGYLIVVASNQGGVASGYKTLDDAIAEMRYLTQLLPEIDYVLFAHTYETGEYGECIQIDATDGGFQWKFITNVHQRFRKPNPGMLKFAMRLANLPIRGGVLMIGDRDEDLKASAAAHIPFIWAETWREGGKIPF